jgi:hypothetical protein
MSKFIKKGADSYSDLIDIGSIKLGNSGKSNSKTTNSNSHNVITKNWLTNDHNISSCYTPNTNIYLNVISNTTYKTYDTYVTNDDLNTGLTLDLFHTMLCKCLDNVNCANNAKQTQNQDQDQAQTNYNIMWQFGDSVLNLNLMAVLDGFFPVEQTITLGEKVLSGDKMLTLKLTEMESKYQQKIVELERQIYDREIVFAIHHSEFGKHFKCKLSDSVLNLSQCNGWQMLGNYMDFNLLTSIKKIIMYNSQFAYRKGISDMRHPNGTTYQPNIDTNHGQFFINSLKNLFDSVCIWLPSVSQLEINYASNEPFSDNQLRSLPNLSKISFIGYGNNKIDSFTLIQNCPKLKHIIYKTCLSIHQLDQIKNWCDSKNIKLEIN